MDDIIGFRFYDIRGYEYEVLNVKKDKNGKIVNFYCLNLNLGKKFWIKQIF